MSLPTGTRLGPYEIVKVLGAGGMGVVYKAHDPHLNRPVALKVLRSDSFTAERRARFLREARAASALNHPHIVHVHDVARAADEDFIVMEYVEGDTLDRLIGGGRLPLRDAIRYAAQIADALAAAHAAGIVHRDLKPANVIITADSRSRERVAKLLDFGIAKMSDGLPAPADATRTTGAETFEGTLLGSVPYMSPEQAEGKPVDARSDVFSFGTLLYETVTGRHPFARGSTLATLSAILHEEPVAVGTLREGIPSGEPRRALARTPYGSADARVSWASDNRHVVLAGSLAASGRPGRHLYLSDTETGALHLLTSGISTELSPSVSPEGTRIAFASGSEDADLIQVAVDGSDAMRG